MLEKTITNKILKHLKSDGFWCVKIHGGQYQQAGLPDILAIKDGRAYWFEVKRPGQKPTPLQVRTVDVLKQHGCVATVVTSLEEVMEWIR